MKIPDLIFKNNSLNLKDSQSQMEGKGKQKQTNKQRINKELVKMQRIITINNIKKYWEGIFSFGIHQSSLLSKKLLSYLSSSY